MDAETFHHLTNVRIAELRAEADEARLVRQLLRSRPTTRSRFRSRLGAWLIQLGRRLSPEPIAPAPCMAEKVA